MQVTYFNPLARQWCFFAICCAFFFGASFPTYASQEAALESEREFWVWDLNVMPPGFRRAKAVLRASGEKSLIYVEDSLWEKQIKPDYMSRLKTMLEVSSPRGALLPKAGVIPAEEAYFGRLPKREEGESRLIVLFADLGKYKNFEFDGFFNVYDQVSEAEAQKEGQHSNEANIIYLNGLRRDENYTNGVISHELQHLLSYDGTGEKAKDNWLSETLAEGAMLVTGHFTDQLHVNQFAKNTGANPLVSSTYISYGPQLLFASYLLDFTSPGVLNLSELSRSPLKGRDAVEALFHQRLGNPQTFDAIYSAFVSYVLNANLYAWSLPTGWDRQRSAGITVPEIAAYKTISSFPSSTEGWVYPYAFVAIDLAKELPDTAKVSVEVIRPSTEDNDPTAKSCARTASALWKPVDKKRIAVYAVGCEPKSKADMLHFRLTIVDRASPKAVTARTLSH